MSKGSFAKSPGRPKKGDHFMEAIKKAGGEQPEELHYRLTAIGLAISEEDIPTFKTVLELRAWAIQMAALRGDDKAITLLADRESPKPQRVTIEAEVRNSRAPAGALGETDEAEEYVRRLGESPALH